MNEANEKAWVEVTYTVVITEERTVRLPLNGKYDNTNEETLYNSCLEAAKRNQATIISSSEHMKIATISTPVPKIKCIYYDDGNGRPDAANRFEFKQR